MPNITKTAAVESETRTTTGNLALAPPIGQPILTGSRAIPNNAPLIKRLLNIRLDDHLCKLILVAAASYSNPWAGEDGGVCLAKNSTLWELAETTRRHFYERWKKLKAIGLVEVRRRGPGRSSQVIIRAVPTRLVPPGGNFKKFPPGGTSRSAPGGGAQKDLDLGSVRGDAVASSSTPRARDADRRQQQQRQHARIEGQHARIEGLIGCLAVTNRALQHPFSESRVREALAAGRITVTDLQRQVDELRPAADARAGEAVAAQALERSGGYAAAFKCGACETMQYPEPGGQCPGCGEAMRR